jgi:hypothetical protein
MTLVSCPCEKEIRELVERGQWPQASPPDLRNHAAKCRTCADLVLIASAFQRARTATIAASRPVSPGAIWWRAQLRSRQQAFQRIERPLIGAQVFALAAVLLTTVGFIAFEARHGLDWLDWLGKASQSAGLHAGSISSASSGTASGFVFVVVAAVTFALVAGVAVYFATERK